VWQRWTDFRKWNCDGQTQGDADMVAFYECMERMHETTGVAMTFCANMWEGFSISFPAEIAQDQASPCAPGKLDISHFGKPWRVLDFAVINTNNPMNPEAAEAALRSGQFYTNSASGQTRVDADSANGPRVIFTPG
jgi:hypothetical protein